MGVWIETALRGAKVWDKRVTPCVGVWIETGYCDPQSSGIMSHPAWVCGLKHVNDAGNENENESHPAWVCGLKPTIKHYANIAI